MLLFHCVILFASFVHAGWFSSNPDYARWSDSELRTWLEQHNIRVPASFDKSHLHDLVGENWKTAPAVLSAYAEDSRLRDWLEEHGVVEARNAPNRDELVHLANEHLSKATSAVWESWSDSYIREWLVAHKLLKVTETPSRASLVGKMKTYYYNGADNVWDTWSDSELKAWLVDHGLLKSDAQKSRDALIKMVQEHYLSALDSVWGAWSDSDIRQWLSNHGYLDAKKDVRDRKDLVDLINRTYPDGSVNMASYLTWTDARLRAYLRERGVPESVLPTSRPGLLQETRIRWVQVTNRAETAFSRLKEIINNSVEAAKEKATWILLILSGHSRDVSDCTDTRKEHTWNWGMPKCDQARGDARETVKATDEL